MTFRDNAGRKGKSTDQNLFDYYADLHPKTESQFRDQKFLAGISDNYRYWMSGRADDEYNAGIRDMYDLSFSDITHPWRSEVSGGSGSQALGRGVLTFSRNMTSLHTRFRPRNKSSRKRNKRRTRR